MKKNIAMRVAAFLFILTMISTCAFATTFAKYTTSGVIEDTARVAKFGVTVTGKTADQHDVFVEQYKNGDDVVTVEADVAVVAPGTFGTFADFEISGSPEVSVEVSFDSEVALTGWAVTDDTFYCPIVVTVYGQPINGLAYNTAAEFIKAIDDAIEAETYKYSVGDTISAQDLEISWKWVFEVDGTEAEKKAANEKDTELGDAAAAGNAPTITLKVTCIVSQID